MNRRKLGSEGLEVSAQGLGCMGTTHAYGQGDEQSGLETIHRALELGVTFLDTAEIYGPYTNEQLVGRAIAGRRDEVELATKSASRPARLSPGAVSGGRYAARPRPRPRRARRRTRRAGEAAMRRRSQRCAPGRARVRARRPELPAGAIGRGLPASSERITWTSSASGENRSRE